MSMEKGEVNRLVAVDGSIVLSGLLDALAAEGRPPFERLRTDSGLELLPAEPATERARRCRLRILPLTEGAHAGKHLAFFYKPSAVPHSTDRYSYGGVIFDASVTRRAVEEWIRYLASGFAPDDRPAELRRALPFTVPEFAAVQGDLTPGTVARRDSETTPTSGAPLNPCELEIELFCRGLRIDPSCSLETDARVFTRTRAGLGSGLELVLPGPLDDIYMNAPVEEDFAQESPYRLVRRDTGDYELIDDRGGRTYPVRLPGEPLWYARATTRGTPMARVGVLQGTYLGIYLSNSCGFWYHQPEAGCHFCTTGLNVGVNEVAEKHIDDVVEVALAAKNESGVTFVHLNSGYHGGDRDLDVIAPYVKALKERVGILVGVQAIPSPNLWKYDWLIDLGANHFSFCYEFHDPEYFARYCPGKARWIGQEAFFEAIEYCSRRLGKGTCSGEIIAGVEPIDATLRAIDFITNAGAFPTVCIFRPTIGAALEHHPPPQPEEMVRVMRHMFEACERHGIPVGLAPNIQVSLIVSPEDARYLVPDRWKTRLHDSRLAWMRRLARPYFARELKPRRIRASATDSSRYRT